MNVTVTFYSYFKEMTGCPRHVESMPEGSTLADLVQRMQQAFPKLQGLERSLLMAVGVEYQRGDYQLREGDQVSLFPPVQGG